MLFNVYKDSECSQSVVDDDPDSRDSGVSMSTDVACRTEFAFAHPQGFSRKTSLQKNLVEMDEELEDLVLNELIADFNGHENVTDEQLAVLSYGTENQSSSSSSSRRMFTEITNTLSIPESPKSHFQNSWTRTKRLTENDDVIARFSRQRSCFESRDTVPRKRTLCEEATIATKRMNVASASHRQVEDEAECARARRSFGFPRTVSSGVLERGEYAHIDVAQLPKILHVEYSLETVSRPQIDSVAFKSIDGSVLASLLRSMNAEDFLKKYIVVDCRYPYEYNGGHVRGAINMFDPSLVEQIFYPNSPEKFNEICSRIPIFYCEFSQKRGPTMAAALRQFDRKRNEARYPEVDYKEIYLLDRGYKNFFETGTYAQLCEPSAYVRMLASPYKDDLKRYQMLNARSSSTFGTTVRMIDMQRRGRLNFSVSMDGGEGGPSRHPRRRDLFGSPFSTPNERDETVTPTCTPKTNPIPMASFS
ncbi:M-phase inducer phosphatase cdc-25.1 [Toxocara canis]|uniref:M-phase inducer phosphatase n=1 Tax=Toxocara canis TaxID=6265 RepID=A0A0B2V996_TOXCA|nr:M-phase inducer phosphatase cdc-25.1 [Toxocara canis]